MTKEELRKLFDAKEATRARYEYLAQTQTPADAAARFELALTNRAAWDAMYMAEMAFDVAITKFTREGSEG